MYELEFEQLISKFFHYLTLTLKSSSYEIRWFSSEYCLNVVLSYKLVGRVCLTMSEGNNIEMQDVGNIQASPSSEATTVEGTLTYIYLIVHIVSTQTLFLSQTCQQS